jgi:amino acid transporter
MLMRGRYGIVTALYNVIWSYIGYSNANYALSEAKDPVKVLKRAAPAALILVSILYMLVNVSLLLLSSAILANR